MTAEAETCIPDEIPLGARVRITDVAEGILTVSPSRDKFVANTYVGPANLIPFVRTYEVLELPRPDEPTKPQAVVLARHIDWRPDDTREVFVLLEKWTRVASGVTGYTWSELKDITVLHPGGAE